MIGNKINNLRQLSSSTSSTSSNESNEIEGGNTSTSSNSDNSLLNDKFNSTTSSAMTTPSQSSDTRLHSVVPNQSQPLHSSHLHPSFPTSLLNFLSQLELNPTNLDSHLSNLSSLSNLSDSSNKSKEQEAIVASLGRLAYRLNKLESGVKRVESESQGTINLVDKVVLEGDTVEEIRKSCSQEIDELKAAHSTRIRIFREQLR